jgi:SAM-dependent methyltransferase
MRLIDDVQRLSRRPELWEPGAPLFWDDPHISQEMLKAHLDPNTDAASRSPEGIDRTVRWLVDHLEWKPGDALLDLGCGPGLYASRLARKGLEVTGVDYSRNSIAYATNYARIHDLPVHYVCQDFLTIEYKAQFKGVLQIYGEVCTLSPPKLDRFLGNVRRALRPGGRFVFDVSTRRAPKRTGRPNWYAVETGFWKPGPHLVLEQGFHYDEESVHLDQYIVIEEDGTIQVYRNWLVDYTLETITAVLEHAGFEVESAWSDLCGTEYRTDSEFIGVVATKKDP